MYTKIKFSFGCLKMSVRIRIAALILPAFFWFISDAQELIAVMDLQSDGSVSQGTIKTICDSISAEIARDVHYSVFDRNYLPFVLQQLNSKQPTLCSDAECLGSVGNLVGTNQIVGGSIVLKKDEIWIRLDRVDVKTRRSLQTVLKKMQGTRKDLFLASIPAIVKDLMNTPQVSQSAPGKKGSFKQAIMWVGGSAIAAGTAAAIYYFVIKKGPQGEEPDVPMDNEPAHSR
jgi:hypothetical protein